MKQAKELSSKRYMCLLCGYIYDEAQGHPEEGIMAGTAWDDIPLTWRCPDCGAMKEDFEMVEI
jgi:rubredoxin